MKYLTDEFCLYEVIGLIRNYGLRGGEILTVRDCISELTREMSSLEERLCRTIEPHVA